jgi:hypothetical protein
LRWSTALLLTGVLAAAAPSTAAGPGHDVVPSTVPANQTPAFGNGGVHALVQVGSTMVAGGNFDNVTPPGGSARTVTGVVAFSASTGQLVAGFDPSLNGDVEDLLPGPTPGTVYLAGSFTRVNGAAQSHVTLLDISTGEIVDGFRPAATNGKVNALTTAHGRLLLGGTFTTVGGQQHRGLGSLDPETGALDPLVGVDVTGHHNDTGSGAQGAVGVRDMEATSDGDKVAVVGNFKQADGLARDQLVVLDVTNSSAAVDADWRTRRYEPYCYSWAFDSYMRGVAVSPDDSFFVVSTTGGGNPGTLCDAASRFDFDTTGDDVQPTWVDNAGGDTLWGIEVTENAVYVGGHQRWMNNAEGRDSNGQGSVPRPGLAALDPDSGLPLSWNPGRNPRGEAAYAIYGTPDGLWVGSNTAWIGNRQFRRPRLAFFSLADGAAPAAESTPSLPGDVYLGGSQSVDQGNVLFRVNAGGPEVDGIDGGPAWVADSASSSPYRNGGSNVAGYDAGATLDGSVPASTPATVFDTERWSPSDNPRMSWDFPVDAGLPLQVRLYFANRCTCTNDPGERVFDVALDGTTVLDDFDIADATGDQRGTMRSFDIASDGNVDIDFSHVVENPLINAIEIVRRDLDPPSAAGNSLATIGFDGTSAESPDPTDPRGIDWNAVRGAFVVGDTLFTAETDGYLHRRTFTADETGADRQVDPYNDPKWSDVDTGSNNTYRGRVPSFYGQIAGLTGVFYDADRIYYTRSGDNQLHWRWFNADSGIIGSETFTATGGRDWSDTGGMFLDDTTLYVVSRSTGRLDALPFAAQPQGPATLIDDSVDWRANAVFLGPVDGSTPPPNESPTARFTVDCTGLSCTTDGSESSDPESDLTSYTWDFGDGATADGVMATHEYDTAGPYTIRLDVTDGSGASDSTSREVTIVDDQQPPASDIDFATSGSNAGNNLNPSVAIPDDVPAGAVMVLVGSYQGTATPDDPDGWTRVDESSTQGMNSAVWTRTATASDAGDRVTTPLGSRLKFAMTVGAYSGVDPTDAVAAIASATDGGTAQHQSPSLDAGTGSWVVQVWSDKSSATTAWQAPTGVAAREQAVGAGGGRITSLYADSAGPVTAGPAGGQTAVTDASSGKGISWTLTLSPAS